MSCQPPAGNGVNTGLFAADAHRPGRDGRARCVQPRGKQSFVQPAQVREPRQEPQHINAVFPPGVQRDDFCFGQPRVLCHKGQVGAEIAAVAYRDRDQPPLPRRGVRAVSVTQPLQAAASVS